MGFRIVVNIGDVLVEGSQIYGECVNVTARLTPSLKSVHLVLEKFGLLVLLCKFHRSARSVSPLTWAQRLKRMFGIDVQTCAGCGGTMRIIASIEDTVVIEAKSPGFAPRDPTHRRALVHFV